MKKRSLLLIALISALLTPIITQAESAAGDDSARYYKSTPEEFDGDYVDVDCVFVTRINRGPEVEGVTFFVASTDDEKNHSYGGSIVVAVLSEDAEHLISKYGNTATLPPAPGANIKSKRLRGIFHELEHGQVYIDYTGGDAHEIIAEHNQEAEIKIDLGDQVSPQVPKLGA
jgi:hypothetical protein